MINLKRLFSIAFFSLATLLLSQTALRAQNSIYFSVKDSSTSEMLAGVSIILESKHSGTSTDADGKATLSNIPNGAQKITFGLIGYPKTTFSFSFPASNNQNVVISLLPEAEEMEEVTVTATRTNSRIEDLPTRIEVMGRDDMVEENGIKPGNVMSILGDIAGIQMQQTSTASGNFDARILGLNGRYSQILKDGMPLYGGFSGSFSVLQIPPIDLKQIEIIKGSASTLYGGDAIGGIINLVTKDPSSKPETSFLINQTTLKESDINTFISRKYEKAGFTFFAGYTYQKATDVNKDGFSDVPDIGNLVIHPKLFLYPDKKTSITLGFTTINEHRKGGDMTALENAPTSEHPYLIKHQSFRNVAEIEAERKVSESSSLSFKASTSFLNRTIKTMEYSLDADQTLYYSEFSWLLKKERYNLVTGLNLTGDRFSLHKAKNASAPDYKYATVGLFAQNTWNITPKLVMQSGLRYDYHNYRKSFVLPQLSFMYKFTNNFTTRLNGGFGYKIPVLFSYIDEETDLNKAITSQSSLKVETSRGANFDVNYIVLLNGGINLTLNQSFFYTMLYNPVTYAQNGNSVILSNADKPIETKGLQSYTRLSYNGIELYLSYVYTHAVKKYDTQQPWFLATPSHNLSGTLAYEPNEKWRFGIESALFGRQHIENGEKTRAYIFMAGMISRRFNKLIIVLNCENMLDFRQKDYLIPPVTNPAFKTLWAPIDGRVINLSLNLKL